VDIADDQWSGFILYSPAARTCDGAVYELAGIGVNNQQIIHFAAHETTVLLNFVYVFRHGYSILINRLSFIQAGRL
jgi:hypothetical protein